MRFMFTLFALIALACAGEPFTGVDNEIQQSPGIDRGPISAGSGGANVGGSEIAGTSGRRATIQGGELPEPISGGAAGAGGAMVGGHDSVTDGGSAGSPAMVPEPMCRIDGDLCQCYSDPSLFEPGWLNVANCPASTRCASRDATACVCWDTEAAYTSALMNGFTAEGECPSVQDDG